MSRSDAVPVLDRAAAQARCDAATTGPWESYGLQDHRVRIAQHYGVKFEGIRTGAQQEADVEFIAHARTDLPKALAMLDAIESLLGTVERNGFMVEQDIPQYRLRAILGDDGG